MVKPIQCLDKSSQDEFVAFACQRLAEKNLNEHQVFEDGMSVTEIIGALAATQKYSQWQNWTRGFCFHSDWLWGFFINFYNIAVRANDPQYKDYPGDRLVGFNDSEIQGSTLYKLCNCGSGKNNANNCNATTAICHYQTPASMENLTSVYKTMYPSRFKAKTP